jgi:hypothetical protein
MVSLLRLFNPYSALQLIFLTDGLYMHDAATRAMCHSTRLNTCTTHHNARAQPCS